MVHSATLTGDLLLTHRVVHDNCARMSTECQLVAAGDVRVSVEDPQLRTASNGLLFGGDDVVLSRHAGTGMSVSNHVCSFVFMCVS